MTVRHVFYNIVMLDERDCASWAREPYWDFSEAIELSMGISPYKDAETDTDEATAAAYEVEFSVRERVLKKARAVKQIDNLLAGDGQPYIVYHPATFSKWAKKAFSSFPENLFSAVMQHYQEHPGKPRKVQKTPPGKFDSAESSKEMTDKRWGLNRERKTLVREFVEREATRTECTCLPKHMHEVVCQLEAEKGAMLVDGKILTEGACLDYIKCLYSEELKIPRTHNGRIPSNTCPLHGDKKRAKR